MGDGPVCSVCMDQLRWLCTREDCPNQTPWDDEDARLAGQARTAPESKLRLQVREFHRAFGVPVLDRPEVPSEERVRLRLRLVAEEFQELLHACLDIDDDATFMMEKTLGRIIEECPVGVMLPEAADALADIQYVLHGTALEFGVDMGPIEDAVHASNMAKAGGPVVNGKVTKPPGWTPPDILGELTKQGFEG